MAKRFINHLYIPFTLGLLLAPFAFGKLPLTKKDCEFLLDGSIIPLQAPVAVVAQEFDCEPINLAATQKIINRLTPPVEQPGFNALPILREDIYKKTTGPVTRRSLLDMPALTPDFFDSNCWLLTADFFFNYSPRVFFTKDSAFLNSYIDLNNENIINSITDSFFPDADIPGLFGLFSRIKLQQYRVGFMAGFARHWKTFTLTGRIPLYYLLENFFLQDDEIERIKNNPFFRTDDGGVGDTPKEEVRRFILRHLVSDRLGVGDSRVTALLHTYCSDNCNVWFGLQTTIPTAKAIQRGLIAGEFDPLQPIPPFNLQTLTNTFLCNNNQELADATLRREFIEDLTEVLDRLSTILINTPLGNGKHFGFGPELDIKYQIDDYFSMQSYASLQAYTPHRANRFYLIQKTESDFDRNWRDPALTGENLVTLNRLIVQTLFPIGIRTTIHPGVRFQMNHAFLYKSEHWDLSLGFDYWYMAQETQELLLPVVPFNLPLVAKKGCRPAAQQGKLFSTIGYFHNSECYDWYFTFNYDATVFNTGIGRNYTLSFRLGFEF